jgi:hypothetical protein
VGTIINYLKPLMPDEREKFSDSFVFAKIVEFNSPNSLVDKMVYTLNTQNTMKNSYTISNDPIVQTVKEKINNNTKYFLEVKPNEFLFEKEKNCSFNKMAKNKIDIETFIQSFVSFYDINKMASLSKNNKALLFRKENINKIITELKYDEALFSYEVYLKLMDIIKDYRAYRKNIEKKDVIGILGIKEYEIDTYRFLNTGNYLIMYALGYEYVKYEIEPISNIVTMIKKISNLFNDEKNVANATKIRETFDKVKNMIDREKSKSNLHR